MNRKFITVIGVALAVLFIGAFVVLGMNNEANAPSTEVSNTQQSNVESPSSAQDAPAEQATITFNNDGFSPAELTVKKGTVVTVKNASSNKLQFASDEHPAHTENQEMNLRVLNAGESETYTANTVGEWGFHDHIEDNLTGMITVTQ